MAQLLKARLTPSSKSQINNIVIKMKKVEISKNNFKNRKKYNGIKKWTFKEDK